LRRARFCAGKIKTSKESRFWFPKIQWHELTFLVVLLNLSQCFYFLPVLREKQWNKQVQRENSNIAGVSFPAIGKPGVISVRCERHLLFTFTSLEKGVGKAALRKTWDTTLTKEFLLNWQSFVHMIQ
jgi:hypothetical protein